MDGKYEIKTGAEGRDFKTWTPEQQAFAINTQELLETCIKSRGRTDSGRVEYHNNQNLLKISNAEAYLKGQPHDSSLAKEGIFVAIDSIKSRINLATDATEIAAARKDEEILSKVFDDFNGLKE